ncbi:hypothetical protein [Novipirellula caenicola]|uniref:hypothetical protein n=1 Tax=Novipirellula caenicola TaxID=1536901 RepID=UPI0031E606A8
MMSDEGLFHTYVMLMLSVNWKSAKFKGRIIQPGQMVFAWRELPERLRGPMAKPQSVTTLRKRIDSLAAFGVVSVESTPRYTLLTILDWENQQSSVSNSDTVTGVSVSNFDTVADTIANTDRRRVKKGKKTSESKLRFDDSDLDFARWMLTKIKDVAPRTKEPNLNNWADTIRLMREQDSLTLDEIREVFGWANADRFWSANILCPAKLRNKFAELDAQMRRPSRSGAAQYKPPTPPQPIKRRRPPNDQS